MKDEEIHKLTILSIDGGGIRGVVPLYLLNQLELELRKKLAQPDFFLSKCFNILSGTSTGAIITAGLSVPDGPKQKPLYDTDFILKAYLDAGTRIFRASTWESFKSLGGLTGSKYSSIAIEKYFHHFFKNITMADLLYDNMIVAYSLEKRIPVLFSGGKRFKASPFYVKDALRASTSAPIYFQPSAIKDLHGNEHKLIDGGVVANSSTLVLLQYLLSNQYINKDTELTWISLGTGFNVSSLDSKELDGAFSWLFPLLDILNTGSSNNVSAQTDTFIHHLFPKSEFIRINPPLTEASHNLDDISPENLSALQHSAQLYIDHHPVEWNHVIELLLNNYTLTHA